jgi:plasmid maintenance system killer protein
MVVYFRYKKLQKLCNSRREADKSLGSKMSKKLQQRLMELGAAATLADISHLPPARCHELAGNRSGQLSVDLEHPYRLIFIPADGSAKMKKDGGLNWEKITGIEIIEITDTH